MPTATTAGIREDRPHCEEEDEKRMHMPIVAEFVDAEGTMKKEKAVVKRLTEGRRQLLKGCRVRG